MTPTFVKETYNATLKQFEISLEVENGKSAITLVVSMESGPTDPTIMHSCLEYMNARLNRFRVCGLTVQSFVAPSLLNQFSMLQDMSVRKSRKRKTRNVGKSFPL